MSKTIKFNTLRTIVTTIPITQVLMKMFNHFDLYFIAVCTKRLAKPARRKCNSNNDHPKDNAQRCQWDNAQRVKRPRYAQKNAKRKHPDKHGSLGKTATPVTQRRLENTVSHECLSSVCVRAVETTDGGLE